MKKRLHTPIWKKRFTRGVATLTRMTNASGGQLLKQALKPAGARRAAPPGAGNWLPGVAMGLGGTLRWRLYRPPGVGAGEPLPLMVMRHGCGQDAAGFAASTRMNRIAEHGRFLVLHPEQDRRVNPQACWSWFDTGSGRGHAEADLILSAIDQVCLFHRADRQRVALAGLSAGASMAALLVTRHPASGTLQRRRDALGHCARHGKFHADGPAAARGRRANAPLAASPGAMVADWPALLVIHGDADGTVSPHNAGAAVLSWAQAAGAQAGVPRQVRRGQRHPVSVTDCKLHGDTVATLVLVAGLGHACSGSAAGKPYSDARGPDASRMAWAFAERTFRA